MAIRQHYLNGELPFIVVSIQTNPAPVLFGKRYYVRRGNRTTAAEEDLIDALSEAVPSIKQNILESLDSEESIVENKEDTINPDNHLDNYEVPFSGLVEGMVIGASNTITLHYSDTIQKKIEEKPNLDLTELLKESVKRTRDELATQRNERLNQARITFIIAIVALVIAIILVFIGVILIFTNKAQEGIVSSVASIVSGIVSGLVLAFNKQTNDRMDEYAKELVTLEKSYTAMQYISFITDIQVKDEAIRELAKSIVLRSQGSK